MFLLLEESSAHAFCRTTTAVACKEDSVPGTCVMANHDSVTEGCPKGKDKEGNTPLPLWWRNACVGYSIQEGGSRWLSREDAANALNQAFTRWTGATCQTSGNGRSRPSIDVRYLGPVECGKVEYNSLGPNQNVIVFRDETWPKKIKEVLGLTTASYSPDTGEIFNVDMEFNTFEMAKNIAIADDEVTQEKYDFASVATHEAGHFFGIAHSDVKGATMYASYHTGEASMRNLSPDDVLAICSVYRPDGNRLVTVRQQGETEQMVFLNPQCNPTPRKGYTSACKESGCMASASPSRPADPFAFGTALALLHLVVRRRRSLEPRRVKER